MTDFKAGDVVDVVIKGVRVAYQHDDDSITITAEAFGGDTQFLMPPQASIELVVPADWPPQPGDLWRWERPDGPLFASDDQDDFDLFFAHFDKAIDRGGSSVVLIAARGDLDYDTTDPEKLRAFGGHWTLERREQQDGGENHADR